MQDFPPNSAKARAQSEGPQRGPERVECVTSAEASRRKTPLGRKFKETFIGGSARMALDYVVVDIAVPAIRDLMFDAFQGYLDRVIYGDSRRRLYRSGPMSSSYSNPPRVNYGAMSTSTQTPPMSPGTRMLSRRTRARQGFDDIIISSRVEAQEVLDTMFEFLSRSGVVTVYELYGMTGIAATHTDHKWGWTSLTGAKVARLRNGEFLLDLPEPQPL